MKTNIVPLTPEGGIPVPSNIGIRIADLVSKKTLVFAKSVLTALLTSEVTELAFEVDSVIAMPRIMQALEIMKQKVAFEHEQKLEAERRMRLAEEIAAGKVMNFDPKAFMAGMYNASQAANGQLRTLVKALDEYVSYLHRIDREVTVPLFLCADAAKPETIERLKKPYSDEQLKEGEQLRRAIAAVTPAWLGDDPANPDPAATVAHKPDSP